MTQKRDEPRANYDDAMSLVRTMKDPPRRLFVMAGVTTASMLCLHGDKPLAPFDMLFLVKTMKALFERRQHLTRVLAGEDIGWWADDE
jgi:hypothetical protein